MLIRRMGCNDVVRKAVVTLVMARDVGSCRGDVEEGSCWEERWRHQRSSGVGGVRIKPRYEGRVCREGGIGELLSNGARYVVDSLWEGRWWHQ